MSEQIVTLLDQCIADHPLPTCDSYTAMTGARDEIIILRQQLTNAQAENEVLRARVAQLESAVPWTIYGDNLTATILRKQAEAAEEGIVYALRTVGNVDPFEVNIHKFANDYAQRLRQQAGKAGGEHD